MTNRVRVSTSVDPKAGNDLDKLRAKFSALQKQSAKGLMIGAGVAATNMAFNAIGRAVGAVTDVIGDSIKASSDLTEAQGKSNVVFGAAADQMDAFARKAAEAFGISERAALDAGAGFGNFFTGLGESDTRAQQMSQTLVGLAGDLASFFNISTDDALAKLQSGLSGEAEPLRRVGVFLTEAKVKAKAMELGLADAHGELSEGAKVLARYHIILDETKNAQGDFARTSDGVANSQRKVTAEIENQSAALGQRAIPVQKAWLDAQSAVLGGLADHLQLSDAMTEAEKRLEQQGRLYTATLDERVALQHQIFNMWQSEAIGADAAAAALEKMHGAIWKTDQATVAAKSGMSDLNRILDRMGYEADDADKAIGDLSSTISDELFGDAINAGNLAQLQITHDELIKQRDAAGVGAKKYRELTGAIAENEQAMFDLQLQMAQEAGPKALAAFLDTQMKKLGYADGAAVRYFNDLKALYNLTTRFNDLGTIDFGQYSGKTIPGFASGVQNFGGGLAVVGEDGPELVNLPKGADVIPSGNLSGGSGSIGGGLTVQFNSTWPPTQAQAAEVARLVSRHLHYGSGRSTYIPD